MAWACMAATRTGSLVVTDKVTALRRSRNNSEVYRAILFAHSHCYSDEYCKTDGAILHSANGY